MEIDFSNINLQYLISLRDIAREDPEIAAPLLGITPRLATLLAQVPCEYMSKIIEVKMPLLAPRGDVIWWHRLFMALADGNPEEIDAMFQAANLAVVSRLPRHS